MSDAVHTVSEYFGPKLVVVGHRRSSFAEAWRDPQLHMRAIHAARGALNAKQREMGKGPSPESEQLSLITNLLLDILLEEGGIG